jgi:hypothetical protein
MSNGGPYGSPHLLQDSAQAWQKVQVGVLGFVGLCGVFSGGATGGNRPPWLQDIGALAALGGLVLALVGVVLVATVAHPVRRRPVSPTAETRRLVSGIVITFVAVALTALAALSWWWPSARDGAAAAPKVAVTTATGYLCGTFQQIGQATLSLNVDGEFVTIPLRSVVSSDVVSTC